MGQLKLWPDPSDLAQFVKLMSTSKLGNLNLTQLGR